MFNQYNFILCLYNMVVFSFRITTLRFASREIRDLQILCLYKNIIVLYMAKAWLLKCFGLGTWVQIPASPIHQKCLHRLQIHVGVTIGVKEISWSRRTLGSTARKLHLKNNNHPKTNAISGPEFNRKVDTSREVSWPWIFSLLEFSMLHKNCTQLIWPLSTGRKQYVAVKTYCYWLHCSILPININSVLWGN